jgi:hypothetical protein
VLLLWCWTDHASLSAEGFAGLSAAAVGGFISSLDAMTRFADQN